MSKQEQMYGLILEYHQSGQSIKSFCTANQIKHFTFQYWLHKEKQKAIGLEEEIAWLKYQVEQLKRFAFGQKRER